MSANTAAPETAPNAWTVSNGRVDVTTGGFTNASMLSLERATDPTGPFSHVVTVYVHPGGGCTWKDTSVAANTTC